MREAIFEVISGDHAYAIYEDGTIEGFPEGSIVINRIAPTMDKLKAEDQGGQ